jgi:pilus assembly protein CpaB
MTAWFDWLRGRNVQLALGAALVAALAFLLARRLLHGQELMVQQRLAVQYATREVLVAARDLAAGEALGDGALARRAVPQRFLASDAYAATDAGQVLGLRLLRALRGGEPVTASAVEPASAAPLSSHVDAGLRALTIPVDESAAAGGLLSPGDLVDVLVLTHPDAAGAAGVAVHPLLQAVPVMATGQRMAGAGRGAVEAGSPDAPVAFSTVTLLLHPQEAERVLLAQGQGELAFLLRTPGDDRPIDLASLDGGAFLPPVARRVQALGGRGGAIEFIVGGVGEAARLQRGIGALAHGGAP